MKSIGVGFVVVCPDGRLGVEEFSVYNVDEDKYVDQDVLDSDDPEFSLGDVLENVRVRVSNISLGTNKLYRFRSSQTADFIASSINGLVLDLGIRSPNGAISTMKK